MSLYYEPRSFWSILNVPASGVMQRVTMNKLHFWNGERWPIEVRRIALAAINYTVTGKPPTGSEIPNLAPTVGANETSSVINRTRVRISVQQRYHLNLRRMVIDAGMAPRRTWMPATQAIFPTSSIWGQCNLTLDEPLIVPRNGAVEWSMSGYTPWKDNSGDEPPTDQDQPTEAWLLYQEQGGMFAGSARVRQIPLLPYLGNTFPTGEGWPYPPDGYGVPTTLTIPSTENWWPPQSTFPAGGQGGANGTQRGTSFRNQESTRAGSSKITELRTYIDQQAYDESFNNHAFATVKAARPTPLSMRVGTRIRTQGSGSNTWWWRPGAPLALVFDTITPAVVMDLPRPFTLRPNEQITVEMEFPPNVTDASVPPQTFQTTYHIGCSLNGFAAIEG